MMRMERKMRMPMMEKMPLHPLLSRHHVLCPLLSHVRKSTIKAP
jgi:hypothetical protein